MDFFILFFGLFGAVVGAAPSPVCMYVCVYVWGGDASGLWWRVGSDGGHRQRQRRQRQRLQLQLHLFSHMPHSLSHTTSLRCSALCRASSGRRPKVSAGSEVHRQMHRPCNTGPQRRSRPKLSRSQPGGIILNIK